MALFVFSGAALGDSYDDQISALKTQAAQQQTTADQLHAQANTYQGEVNALNAQNAALQTQININQAQSADLSAKIAAGQIQMATQKATLAANLKSMYLQSSVTPLEMVVSSNNLSDFFNEQEYQNSIKDKIASSLTSIEALQAQLATQQKAVLVAIANQNDQQAQIQANERQVASLAAVAAQNAAAADQQVQQANAQVTQLRAEQAVALAAAAAAHGGSKIISSGSCGGGYPDAYCNAPKDTIIDNWGMYNRECVSYTAYRVYASGRTMPYWGGHGNANQWPSSARAAGITFDSSPQPGDVAISMAGPYGHAMYVESVNGNDMTVSQYNYADDGNYSVMTVSSSFANYFIHF